MCRLLIVLVPSGDWGQLQCRCYWHNLNIEFHAHPLREGSNDSLQQILFHIAYNGTWRIHLIPEEFPGEPEEDPGQGCCGANIYYCTHDITLTAARTNIQIMTKVYILSCFMPFLAYRDKKRANGPISLSLYSRNGIKQDRIYTEVIICFISQSGHLKQLIIR